MKIENINIEAIIPYQGNAKAHPAAQIKKIAASIREYGFFVPIIIDAKNQIVAGHGRLLAAKKLKLKTVPVVSVEHLTDDQVRAFRLMDNRAAESEWLEKELVEEFQMLSEVGFDLELTGFDGDEIETMLGLDLGLTDPDEIPDIPVAPVTKLNDIWQMGGGGIV